LLPLFAAMLIAVSLVLGSAMPSLAVGGVSGNIIGSVIDATTKSPLTNVTVTAQSPSTTQTAHTDAHGRFSFLGLPTDTYNLTFTVTDHQTFTMQGVTVQGDQTVNLDAQPLYHALQSIGRVRGRAASSVFQPKQTVDSMSVGGTRAVLAAGKEASTNGTALALSVPGVQLTDAGRLTIRGGMSNDVGYQFDGVPDTDPFLGQNSAGNRINGLGSLQVVEGAGDPTQGNIGTGTVNVIVKRGTRPPFGYVDLEAGAPILNNQGAAEYGIATPNGSFSNYFSYVGQRYTPGGGVAGGLYSANQAEIGNAFSAMNYSKINNSDFIDNAVFRFGRDNSQSLQLLVQSRMLQDYGNSGGIMGGYNYYPYAPYSYGYGRGYGTSCGGSSTAAFCSPDVAQPGFNPIYDPMGIATGDPDLTNEIAFYQNKVGLAPYVPGVGSSSFSAPALLNYQPSSVVKLEYTASLNATTFLTARMYNTTFLTGGSNWFNGSVNPGYSVTGGNTNGYYLELDKQASDKHNLQFSANYQLVHPIWNDYSPNEMWGLLAGGTPGSSPSLDDFLNPMNPSAPLSATNQCPVANGCYLFSQLYPNGDPNGQGIGRVPISGINYAGTIFHEYGASIRDQWTPNSRLKLDLGLRMDGGDFSQGCNQYSTDPCGNPSDVDPSFIRSGVLKPSFWEPRTAFSYQFDNNEAVRFSFGRSITYPNAQTFGTPAYIYGLGALANVAPIGNTSDPSTWSCGSGYNPTHAVSGGANVVTAANGGALFQCQSYASQLHWMYDQNYDAPDVGNNTPETDNNYDVSYSRAFSNGATARVTSYFRRGYGVAAFNMISQVLDPTTGAPVSQVFGISNVGVIKTSGVELALQTADHPVGLTGYLSATYTNALDSNPPLIAGEDALPLVPTSSLALGDVYRAGYVSPFTINLGAQYKFKNGFRINPILQFDEGYPIGVGLMTPSGAAVGGSLINGSYQNIPTTNLDSTSNPGAVDYRGSYGAFTSPQYVDPVFAGSYQDPNIAANRGLPETSAAGGFLSHARLQTNLDLEWKHSRNTFGVYIANLIGSHYSEPSPNPFWQPVANGVGGVLTGQQASGNPVYLNGMPYLYGQRNLPSYTYSNMPMIELPTNPTTFQFYYQLAL
jgi:hypothetical protein